MALQASIRADEKARDAAIEKLVPAGPRAEYFLVPECSPMIYRTSRIWSAGALIMAVD